MDVYVTCWNENDNHLSELNWKDKTISGNIPQGENVINIQMNANFRFLLKIYCSAFLSISHCLAHDNFQPCMMWKLAYNQFDFHDWLGA